VGAKLYESEDDTAPTQIGEKKTQIDLGAANYDADDFIDPEILDLFTGDAADQYDADYVEKDYELQGAFEGNIDLSSISTDDFTFDGHVASQNFYSVYESNPFLDMEDEIAFMFELDLPESLL